MDRARRGMSIAVNVALVMVIVALYAVTAQPFAGAEPTLGSAVYMGVGDEAVALQWAVTYRARSMEAILEALEEKSVRSTFFVSGEWARQNPEQLRRIVAGGHEIGTMGNLPFEDGDVSWVEDDLRVSVETIEDICGVRPALYYSWERASAVSSRAAQRLNLTHVLCTLDLLCAKDDAGNILSRAQNAAGGNIILMQPTVQACEAIDELLERLISRGFDIVPTGELIGLYD
ncbi:MAG: polysaccharide deacetylase family protein [Clostridia bacterium]|nr:polysaccharide deacetylase family protein [Clostridia bacterium]